MDFSTLRFSFRSLRRHRGFTLLNVGGLAVGLAAAAIILLFVRDELSYDRFHPAAERIYDLSADYAYQADLMLYLKGMPSALAPTVREELPMVERAARWNGKNVTFVDVGDLDGEEFIQTTDPEFFDLFGYRVLVGDRDRLLDRPDALVVTESAAARYFGKADPVGQSLTTDDGTLYTVTGVLEDPPHNTELSFDMIARFGRDVADDDDAWDPFGQIRTFVRLADHADADMFVSAVAPILKSNMPDSAEKLSVMVERLVDLHLFRQRGSSGDGLYGDITYVWMFGVIAALILLIACINYTNLATARALERLREVGVRKTVGASRGDLIRRFLGESLVMCSIATVLAMIVVDAGLPSFSRLVGKEIAANWAQDGWLIPGFAALTLIVGLLAGVYPAFMMSRFRPVQALKGRVSRRDSRARTRRSLVTFQFVMSVGLIMATFVMVRQLDFMLDRDLGLDPDHVVSFQLPPEQTERYPILKNDLSGIPSVRSVAAGSPFHDTSVLFFDEDIPNRPTEGFIFNTIADEDYVPTMQMSLVAGSNFSSEREGSIGHAVILNETAVREMGLEDPVGKVFSADVEQQEQFHVVGVVQDYHFKSLKQKILPMMIRQGGDAFRNVVVKVDAAAVDETLAAMQASWTRLFPEQPFDYRFMDDQYANLYETERRVGNLFSLAAALAIFVSCLGLFGLAAFSARQRTKEIGIRKVLGASVAGIIGLMSREFLWLVLIAFIVAAPVAWIAMDRWLEDYAYRVDVGPGLFALAGLVAVAIAALTVGGQALRAATANPVDSLRTE